MRPGPESVPVSCPEAGPTTCTPRGIAPHLGVHCRRNHQWRCTGQDGVAEQIICEAHRKLGNAVGCRRSNDDEVCGLAYRHVSNLGDTLVELTVNRIPADRLKGGPSHESERSIRRHDMDVMTGEHESPHHTDGLIGGNAAGDSDDDVQDWRSHNAIVADV
jgi:hypothetical protein